ncbi:sorting nexin-8-like [Chironomus tepperi]|uniref:sorting nexin-8-like n=1 Tax=Chironomus tepperi TaxID=113505 RepID=UPI00391F1FFC
MAQAEFEEVDLQPDEIGELLSDKDEVSTAESEEASSSSDRYISDVIKVTIIPEKKGNFMKYTAYNVSSENYKSTVERRYSDFYALYENYLKIYEYRIIPKLPPKQFVNDPNPEKRRDGLQRWLTIISQHAIISRDIMFKHFLTEDTFRLAVIPSEFSSYMFQDKVMKVTDIDEIFSKRNLVKRVLHHLISIKTIFNDHYEREICQGRDFLQLSDILYELMDTTNDTSLCDFRLCLKDIVKTCVESAKKTDATDRLEMVIAVLTGYIDACERLFSSKDGGNDAFHIQRLKNMFGQNVTCDDEMEQHRNRITFGVGCLIEEYKVAKRYMKLLPSLFLKFAFMETQSFSAVAKKFQNFMDKESDKLN